MLVPHQLRRMSCARKTSLRCPVIHYSPFQGEGSGVVSVSCFGVKVSVMFHFLFVHYILCTINLAISDV